MSTPTTDIPAFELNRRAQEALFTARSAVAYAVELNGLAGDVWVLRKMRLLEDPIAAANEAAQIAGYPPIDGRVGNALVAFAAAVAMYPQGSDVPFVISAADKARRIAVEYAATLAVLVWVDDEDQVSTGTIANLADHLQRAQETDTNHVRAVYQAGSGELRRLPWCVRHSTGSDIATVVVDVSGGSVTIEAAYTTDGNS